MYRIAAVGLIALLSVSCTNDVECDLCGNWKSNAELTISGMEASTKLTDRQRKLFRSNFYGQLVVETTATQSRAYFPDENPDKVTWGPWKVLSKDKNRFITSTKMPNSDTWIEHTIVNHGNCYEVIRNHLGFSEWFCRK
jgi:hypothetical protein